MEVLITRRTADVYIVKMIYVGKLKGKSSGGANAITGVAFYA
jgi:hypothetical protein